MNWDLIIKVVGALAAVSTISVFFWTNLRKDVRRTAIIDLAAKGIAFWNQLLTTIHLATPEDSDERKAGQDKAYKAIQQIQADATLQLQALTRSQKIGRATTWKSFWFERGNFKTWVDAICWWYFALLSVAMLCIAVLILVRVEYAIFTQNLKGVPLLINILITVAFIAVARLFLYRAESLKYDSVIAPIIDSI